MSNLGQFYESYDHFWITNENRQTLSQLQNERKYFVDAGHYKRPWTYLNQVPHFIKIFAKEKPTHIVSTGSGRTALVPFILGRALKIPFIYIDTFSRVYGYSKFGSFLLSLRQQVLCQWPDDKNSRAVYIGPVFKNAESLSKNFGPRICHGGDQRRTVHKTDCSCGGTGAKRSNKGESDCASRP